MKSDRRAFIRTATGLLGASLFARPAALPSQALLSHDPARFSCNVYAWMTFFQRQGRDWYADLDASLAEYASSGLRLFEPSVSSPEDVERLVPLLRKHGLRMESLYVGSELHEPDLAAASIARVLEIGEAATEAGTRILITNPSPLPQGQDKNDSQLETQAENLERLGAELRRRGLQLAYHNHDPELRRAAREFHHMLLATDPAHVGLCLEPHWIYRGSGDSQVALFDIVKLYGARTVAVHLRQSRGGVWTEVLGPGDIDYPRLARELVRLEVAPLLVLEQPVESGTPNTLGPVEAHRQSLAYASRVFADV